MTKKKLRLRFVSQTYCGWTTAEKPMLKGKDVWMRSQTRDCFVVQETDGIDENDEITRVLLRLTIIAKSARVAVS
jgi:hypothetical protein